MKHLLISLLGCFVILVGACTAPPPATLTPDAPPTTDVGFSELVTNPTTYAGKEVCTRGVYLSSFEVEALGEGTSERDGALYLTEPTIWLNSADIEADSACTEVGVPPARFCQAQVCGRFDYGGQYGHLGGWQFQLSGS